MKKDVLTLLGCSSSVVITLMTVSSAHANNPPVQEYVFTAADEATEILTVENPQEDLVAETSDWGDCSCNETDALTDAEGERAIATYGCDCAGCRYMVRNLGDRNL
jgi:hypothetical protein